MDTPESIQHSHPSQGFINRWAGHFLAIGMLVCLAGVVDGVFARLMPFWYLNFLPVFAFLLALESMLSEYRTRKPIDLDLSVGGYIFIEWVIILLTLRIFLYLGNGLDGLQASLHQLGLAFREGLYLEALFDISFLISLLPVVSIWGLARSYAADLRALQGDEVLIAIEDNAPISNRGVIRQQITSRFLMVGIVLVILSGVISLDYSAARPPGTFLFPPIAGQQVGGVWLLAYFILGLILLSFAHQSALRAAWSWERIPIDERIATRWIGLSISLIGLVGLAALILPARYTFGLSDTLKYLLGWVVTIAYALFFLVIYPVIVVFSQLMRLVGLQEGDVLPEMQTPPPPPPPIEQNGLPNWVSLLQSILFWLLLIGIVLYALVMYIRQNQQLMTIFRRVPGWRLLLQAVRWLRDRLRGAGRTVGDLVKTTRQRLSEIIRRAREGSPGMPALRLGRLDARQQVRFYYLALLRRSAESGRPRRPDETPAEYGAALAALLAENEESPAVHRAASGAEAGETAAQPMVATMTDTFIEARYTTHPIDADQVHLVRRAWDQLRRIFRDLARKKQ